MKLGPGVLLLDAAKQLKMGSWVCKSFPALCSKHFEPSCLENPAYTTHFDMKRKVLFWNMMPSQQFFKLVGKSKKVPERGNEPKGAFALRKQNYFNFEGMFLAWPSVAILGWHCMRFTPPWLTSRTAHSRVGLIFKFVNNMETNLMHPAAIHLCPT